MALWLFQSFLLTLTVVLFGIHGLRKLLNPKIKGAITDGIVSRITRLFM